MNINFTPTAIADLEAIRDYIGHFDKAAALKIVARIDTAISFLGQFPELGRKGRVEGTRELVVPETNYIVIYEMPTPFDIFVLTIIHGRQEFPPSR